MKRQDSSTTNLYELLKTKLAQSDVDVDDLYTAIMKLPIHILYQLESSYYGETDFTLIGASIGDCDAVEIVKTYSDNLRLSWAEHDQTTFEELLSKPQCNTPLMRKVYYTNHPSYKATLRWLLFPEGLEVREKGSFTINSSKHYYSENSAEEAEQVAKTKAEEERKKQEKKKQKKETLQKQFEESLSPQQKEMLSQIKLS